MVEEHKNICRLIQSIVSAGDLENLEVFFENNSQHITAQILNEVFIEMCKGFKNSFDVENCLNFLLLFTN
jgi:hypothetical protein